MSGVLVCEDDILQCIDLMAEIEDAGGVVLGCFHNSGDADKAARRLARGIAMIDLNLSDGASGAALARRLARRGWRIVIISGETNSPPVLRSIPHVFVSKPIPPGVIKDLLRAARSAARAPQRGETLNTIASVKPELNLIASSASGNE